MLKASSNEEDCVDKIHCKELAERLTGGPRIMKGWHSKMKVTSIYYLSAVTVLTIIFLHKYLGYPGTLHINAYMSPIKESSDLMARTSEQLDTNVTERFIIRRIRTEKKCASSNMTRTNVAFVSGHAPANLTICVVPKAACTIWLRLFSYLRNKNSSNRSITSYSKHDVFHPVHPLVEKFKRYYYNKTDMDFIGKSVRAMTVRDPYTRLWSAYVDKFVLLDFWDGGVQIIKQFRNNAKNVSKKCGNDVTFQEFIQYVLSLSGKTRTKHGFDNHWMPVTDICDPCMFKPHFIAKQETFLSDLNFVLNQVGLLKDMRPALEVNQDDFEIETEIDFNFRRHNKSPKLSSCITNVGLAKRIWKAMKFNGYLQSDEQFPAQTDEKKLSSSTVFEMVRSARERRGINKEVKKVIRKQALKSAYKQLSKEQLKALKKMYKADFEMFGYDSAPPV